MADKVPSDKATRCQPLFSTSVLREDDHKIRPEVFQPVEGECRWHFMCTAG